MPAFVAIGSITQSGKVDDVAVQCVDIWRLGGSRNGRESANVAGGFLFGADPTVARFPVAARCRQTSVFLSTAVGQDDAWVHAASQCRGQSVVQSRYRIWRLRNAGLTSTWRWVQPSSNWPRFSSVRLRPASARQSCCPMAEPRGMTGSRSPISRMD